VQRMAAVLAFGVGLSQIAATAAAAAPAAAVVGNWSGIYIGAHVGSTRQSASDWTYFNPNNGATFLLTQSGNLGAAGGLQGGYDWQATPAWLLGIEADISWTSLGQTRTVPTIGLGSFATMSATDRWLASLRGRVGFIATNHTLLFYLTGGAAWANSEYRGHMTRIIDTATFLADAASATTKAGWVLGGGAEWMADPHVMLRLEYLYYGFDNEVALSGPIFPGSFLPVTFTWTSNNVQVVRAGMGYKF
jgi:opacity protein-like surface antigen